MQSLKAKTLSLLSKKAYFSKELERKLLEKGYPQREIIDLLNELHQRGWLNDEELAHHFIQQQRKKGYGAKAIAMKLRIKAGMEMDFEESEEDMIQLIHKRYMQDLPHRRDKVMRALLRRGYSYELINKYLASI